MAKILIFGNSSSGKSTLAQKIVKTYHFSHLDLDTVAWKAEFKNPQRRSFKDSCTDIVDFTQDKSHWVIEGCYGDLISFISNYCHRLIFLNPDIETCVQNCRQRPWESHKYDSLEAQNTNLEMLVRWIKDYYIRDDEFSLSAHRQIFDSFKGKKVEYNHNWEEKEVFSWLNPLD